MKKEEWKKEEGEEEKEEEDEEKETEIGKVWLRPLRGKYSASGNLQPMKGCPTQDDWALKRKRLIEM